ncbi:unnamed protein product [Adineta ricciae]|uniref:Leucine-rich repeat-containing protein 27 n=1 Tax=Adineta ricciae TaxID=249248 RepID=A0A815BUZ9_ADIRI|nr:unnamed protein product [Adineta ricciae]CAF1626284.1 unnamed protein product [Adineta ricciae]
MNNLESPIDIPNDRVLLADNADENSLDQLIAKARQQCSNCLDLSKRNLTQFPTQLLDFSSLQYLYLEGNQLKQLPNDLFLRLSDLKWLDLRHNQLTSIPHEGLASHSSLQYLLLSGNNLRTLPHELGKVKTLSALNLDGNPLQHPTNEIVKQGIKAVLQYLRDELHTDDDLSLSDNENLQPTPRYSPRKSRRRITSIDDEEVDKFSHPNLSPLRVQSCKQYDRISYSARHSISPPHSAKKLTQVTQNTITKKNNDRQRDVCTAQEQALKNMQPQETRTDRSRQQIRPKSFLKHKESKKPIAPTASLINRRYTRMVSKEQFEFLRTLSAEYVGKEDEVRRGCDRQIHNDIRNITDKMLKRRLETRESIFEERRQVKREIQELRRLVSEGKQHRPPPVTNRPKTDTATANPYARKS